MFYIFILIFMIIFFGIVWINYDDKNKFVNEKQRKKDFSKYLKIFSIITIVWEIAMFLLFFNIDKHSTISFETNRLSSEIKAEKIYVKKTHNNSYSVFLEEKDKSLKQLNSSSYYGLDTMDTNSDEITVEFKSFENKEIVGSKIDFRKNIWTGIVSVTGKVLNINSTPKLIKIPVNKKVDNYTKVGNITVNNGYN